MKLNVRLNRVIIRLSVMGIRLEVIITEVDVAAARPMGSALGDFT